MLLIGRWTRNVIFTALCLWAAIATLEMLVRVVGQFIPGEGELSSICQNGQSVCLVDLRGGVTVTLVRNIPGARDFNWSHDGDSLVFVSRCEGVYGLCVIEVGETSARSLAAGGASPSFSPRNDHLAFEFQDTIYIAEPAGDSAPQRLSDAVNTVRPRWSPDGNSILTESCADSGYTDIYLVDAGCADIPGGCAYTNLTNSPFNEFDALFSPDGARIAFTAAQDDGLALYVMDADGGRVRRLTYPPPLGHDGGAAWSPDSSRIAFLRTNVMSEVHLYVIDLACVDRPEGCAGQEIPLAPRFYIHDSFIWTPDGQWITFSTHFPGMGIYRVQVDSGELRLVTPAGIFPSWRPR